jgi:alpha-beta hydrolase superfamily lysophospholipase
VVPHGIPRKGVVHFVHGYGDPLPHYSYLAKRFTDQGYEFCGIDQTGFGNSWGIKGRIESMDKCVQDLENFINLYKQRYCSQQTPIFLVGYSFGAKISTFMCASTNHCYNGVVLVTPYFDVYDKEMLNQIGILSLAVKVTPNKLFPAPFQETQLYLQDWIHNGYWTGGMISPHTAMMTTVDSAKEFKSQNIMKKIAMPTLMIKSTRDHTVCGDAIDVEFQRLRALDKTLLEYDTDHFIWQDGENLQKLVCDVTEWCSQRL